MGKIYTQLSLEELTIIYTQLEMGFNSTTMAIGLYRSASTLSRELGRYGWGCTTTRRGPGRSPVAGGYRATRPIRAHMPARSHRALRAACDREPPCGISTRYLKAGDSPKQIGGILALVFADTPRCRCLTKPSTPPSTPCRVGVAQRGSLAGFVFAMPNAVRVREAKTGGDGFLTWSVFMTGRLKLKNG